MLYILFQSKMRPLVVFIILYSAISCLPVTCGIHEQHRAAYDRVVECISVGSHANKQGQTLPLETYVCDAFKV